MRARPALYRVGLLALAIGTQGAYAQQDDLALPAKLTRGLQTRAAPLAPAPRSISDITALLEQHKPDPEKVKALQEAVKRKPPAGADKEALGAFYHERAQAAEQLGMVAQQLADLRRAEALAPVGGVDWMRILRSMGTAEEWNGNFANAVRVRERMASRPEGGGSEFVTRTGIMRMHLATADLATARAELKAAQDMLARLQRNARTWARYGDLYTRQYEAARALMLEAEGKYREAEGAWRNSVAASERFLTLSPQVVGSISTTLEAQHRANDRAEVQLVRNLVLQDKLPEAEVVVRGTLVRILGRGGRYSPISAHAVVALAEVLGEQGRAVDAEAMARAALDIHLQIGSSPESREYAQARRLLGAALVAQSRWPEAVAVYEEMRVGLAEYPALLRTLGHGDVDWALALIRTKRAAEAVTMLEPVVKENTERLGRGHYRPAEQRGFLALGLLESGQRERALAEYREAVRVLLTPGRVSGEERETSPARSRRLIAVLEGYILLLNEVGGQEAAAEAFRVADAMRGHGVQGAVAASAARAAAETPALAELARREQDAKQQLAILYTTLIRFLNAPPDQQLPQVAAQMRKRIAELEKEQDGLSEEVRKRFPSYADLVSPRPATLDEARAALRPGEVLVSVLTTDDRTYVWALPQQGAVAFHSAALTRAEVERMVKALRRALDAGEASIAKLLEFDVAQAGRLYDALMKPVEGTWQGARSLLVVANGALAQLPFGLLPTQAADSAGTGGLRFVQYAKTPWLIRSIAVAQLPAVNTLVTLRALKPGAQAASFAGFGDPQFGAQQVAAAAGDGAAVMRNLGGARGTRGDYGFRAYGDLPSLPDTREEILSIATALKADAQKDVFLGASASRENVKKSELSTRRIVAFATHGLIPGDLPNLEEPALALSAPDGRAETGLLTLGDILGLKLDADWVVLSACNTAAGDGAGAEAISGLGRGFFYAGSRALLVTHWPVETRSARLLVTKLFERYAADPQLTRAEALRQASLAVMNETAPGPDGKPAFSYAHPLFWAPYALVGDGGR